MILKTFTVMVEMKDDSGDPQDPDGLTKHIVEMFRTAEIRSQRGKVDFRIKRITVRRKHDNRGTTRKKTRTRTSD